MADSKVPDSVQTPEDLEKALDEVDYSGRHLRPGLAVMVGAIAAVVLSALLFTVHHVIALRAQFGWNVTLLASAGICVGGAAWSWCYLKYRSIWPGYVSHLVVDATVFVIGWKLIF